MTKLAVLLVLGFSSLASAATLDIRSTNAKHMSQDKDRGGGNAVNGQLFDFYENEGTEKVDVKKLAVYTQVLEPLFKKLDARIPSLRSYLTTSLTEKDWYLEPKPLSAEGCVNSSMIKVQTTIIACQSPYEVRIDSHWLTADTTTPEQAAGLIMHELLVAIMMKPVDYPAAQIREESVRYINRLFFSPELPDALKLQKALRDRNFELLPTAAEITHVKSVAKKEALNLCPSSTGQTDWTAALEYSGRMFQYAGDGRYTLAENSEFLDFGQNVKDRIEFTGSNYKMSCATFHNIVRSSHADSN